MALKYNMEGTVFQVWRLADGMTMLPDELPVLIDELPF